MKLDFAGGLLREELEAAADFVECGAMAGMSR
jgi:hypothetical protein